MNYEVEIYLMNHFKECFSNFPKGQLEKSDPPATDFILTTSQGPTIGIELTEAMHSEIARELSNVTNSLCNKVVAELKEKMHFTFSLDIDLDPSVPITGTNKSKIVQQIVKLCLEEFGGLQNFEHRDIEHIEGLSEITETRPDILEMIYNQGYRNLPPGIKRIRMSRFDGLTTSWNMRGETGVVPNFRDEHLMSIIEKKKKK